MKHEGGTAAWVIEVFDTDAEAQLGEQWLATQYGIPYTWWQIKSRKNKEEAAGRGWRTEEQVMEGPPSMESTIMPGRVVVSAPSSRYT